MTYRVQWITNKRPST